MIIEIPLAKARVLANEIKSTVHAGTEVENTLANIISVCEHYNINLVPLATDTGSDDIDALYALYRFFDDVGMLG